MESVETIRARYRPDRIKTLFVAESPPQSGLFFYCDDKTMKRHMQRAVEAALGVSGDDFLETFKAYGWYLDDLVLTPVNGDSKLKRRQKCWEAQRGLADRIRAYQPEAIVSLLRCIAPIVDGAARMAESKAARYSVPFPGMGHQKRFLAEMESVIPLLPRLD